MSSQNTSGQRQESLNVSEKPKLLVKVNLSRLQPELANKLLTRVFVFSPRQCPRHSAIEYSSLFSGDTIDLTDGHSSSVMHTQRSNAISTANRVTTHATQNPISFDDRCFKRPAIPFWRRHNR